MKRKFLFLATTLAIHSAALAQTQVPSLINYQGHVTTSAGVAIGADSSVNRNVTFRFWKSATDTAAASRLYTETQLVTILKGDFSVLIGSGTEVIGEVKPAMAAVFANKEVFLGITVDDGNDSTTDVEVTPRQQLVSTAFAFRASVAESVASASDLTLTPLSGTASNYGLGWYGTGRLFNSVAVDGPVLYGNSGGALGSSASGSQKLALSWDASGRVGIGATSTTSLTNKLTLQGDMTTTPGDQFTIRGNTDNSERLLLGYDTTNNKASLQSYTGASTTGPLLLNPSGGNVGVNNTGPSVALDVTGAIKASTSITAGAGGVISNGGIQSSNNIVAGTSISAHGNNGHTFYGAGDTDGGLFSPADGTVTIKTNGTERVRVDPGGNVGIGTAVPLGRFTVKSGNTAFTVGDSDLSTGSWIRTSTDTVFSTNVGNMWFGYSGNAKTLNFMGGGTTPAMHINASGMVGIGTTAPTQAKLVVSGSVSSSVPTGYAYTPNGQALANGPWPRNVSIYSSNSIWASELIIVSSDKRIKNISGVSDGAADLGTLMGIEVTNYSYKDVISKGNSEQKKLIAQQVETVFPQAVSKRTDAVPDIYQKAALNDGWVQLATDLKKGERVKLIAGKEEGVHEVLEVGDGKFRTDFKSADAGLFVYGREVNDFRTVDYDAIAMLNVSATQELKREVDVLRAENARLRNVLEARLSALEQGRSEGATVTVSASQR